MLSTIRDPDTASRFPKVNSVEFFESKPAASSIANQSSRSRKADVRRIDIRSSQHLTFDRPRFLRADSNFVTRRGGENRYASRCASRAPAPRALCASERLPDIRACTGPPPTTARSQIVRPARPPVRMHRLRLDHPSRPPASAFCMSPARRSTKLRRAPVSIVGCGRSSRSIAAGVNGANACAALWSSFRQSVRLLAHVSRIAYSPGPAADLAALVHR